MGWSAWIMFDPSGQSGISAFTLIQICRCGHMSREPVLRQIRTISWSVSRSVVLSAYRVTDAVTFVLRWRDPIACLRLLRKTVTFRVTALMIPL